jgi:hypothetical protein
MVSSAVFLSMTDLSVAIQQEEFIARRKRSGGEDSLPSKCSLLEYKHLHGNFRYRVSWRRPHIKKLSFLGKKSREIFIGIKDVYQY